MLDLSADQDGVQVEEVAHGDPKQRPIGVVQRGVELGAPGVPNERPLLESLVGRDAFRLDDDGIRPPGARGGRSRVERCP